MAGTDDCGDKLQHPPSSRAASGGPGCPPPLTRPRRRGRLKSARVAGVAVTGRPSVSRGRVVIAAMVSSKGRPTAISLDAVVARSSTEPWMLRRCKSVEIGQGRNPSVIDARAVAKQNDACPCPISMRTPRSASLRACSKSAAVSRIDPAFLPLKQWVTISPGDRMSKTSSIRGGGSATCTISGRFAGSASSLAILQV